MAPAGDSTRTPFKDNIDAAAVDRLAEALAGARGDLDTDLFRSLATDGLSDRELKERVVLVAEALLATLPGSFPDAAAAVGVVVERAAVDGSLGMWELWPVTHWVTLAGRDHPAVALELLGLVTALSSAEFAVRPFLDDDPTGVLTRMAGWAEDSDEHLRRLVSEGTRPRLPWASRLAVAAADPGFAVPLLDRLVDDPSEYVRRSVSNHLNDLSREDPALGLDVAARWSADADAAERSGDGARAGRIRWVVRRGLRSLVKAGDPGALRLLGHDPDVRVSATDFSLTTPVVALGGHAEWEVTLACDTEERVEVVLDYSIGFPLARGGHGRRVFKWTTLTLEPGDRRSLSRRHRIAPVTIRTTRAGTHPVEVLLNGRTVASGGFDLVLE